MKRLLLVLALLTASCFAQTGSNSLPDPCQNQNAAKQSVVINVSSATTTALVTVSGTTKVYVCGFSLTILGLATTGGTAQFESGTGVACASNAAVLTGSFLGANTAGASTPITSPPLSGSVTATPAANGLCLVTTGTAPSFQGIVTFIQQ